MVDKKLTIFSSVMDENIYRKLYFVDENDKREQLKPISKKTTDYSGKDYQDYITNGKKTDATFSLSDGKYVTEVVDTESNHVREVSFTVKEDKVQGTDGFE